MTEPDAGPIGNLIVAVFLWLFKHGAELVPVTLALCVVIVLGCSALLWFRSGARYIWAWRQWRSLFHPGGAGGHSREYQRTMQSAGWRRRRSRAIRGAGGRCQRCGDGGRLDVHHLSYRHLGEERPYELAVLCPACHQAAHGRNNVRERPGGIRASLTETQASPSACITRSTAQEP